MVGMHFPPQMTEEEEILQQKYAKLKKKKKALVRIPKLEKQESVTDTLKRSAENADPSEQAKKLMKLAAMKEALENKDKTFKRTKRKKDTDNKSTVAFHPFSHGDGESSVNNRQENEQIGQNLKQKYNLYENFVASSSHSAVTTKEEKCERKETIKKGHTIYVNGSGLTDEMLRKAFMNCGMIVNISLEPEKHCAFVTFDRTESADRAIDQLNGMMISNTVLKVSLARHQPNMDHHTAGSSTEQSSTSWSTIAASSSQKGNHKDKRDLVTYDEGYF